MRHSQPGLLLGLSIAVSAYVSCAGSAIAQDAFWVQTEAHRSITEAEEAARETAERFDNVSAFALSTGWYGVAMGPYSRADAADLLARLKAENAIPADSFITDKSIYRGQLWPPGATLSDQTTALPKSPAPTQTSADNEAAATTAPSEPNAPDEDRAAALASESALSREDKRALQVALRWAGHYEGAIDGLYGPGTRNAMASWQGAQNYPQTGVLTTGQRAELRKAYDSILDGMGLQVQQDDAAGIRMAIPMGVVAFKGYEPPFARFGPKGDLPGQVLLISQEGTSQTLAGLYEIMQTLEIVPPEGPRNLSANSFTLEGQNERVHSYTEATLEGGQIKGYSLVWPAGDEARRTRVLGQMRESFQRIEGVLDPTIAPPDDSQSADLVSGLAVRQPLRARTGTYIDARGTVLTTAEAVRDCGRIELNATQDATVAYADDDIAVLTPDAPLSPLGFATFLDGVPRLKTRVALAGFPFDGVLPRASMTFGTLEDLNGLDGDARVDRLNISARDSEHGGPIMDNSGLVIGMLVPAPATDGKLLPESVGFSLDSGAILQALDGAGQEVTRSDVAGYASDESITRAAGEMTVLVRCWE